MYMFQNLTFFLKITKRQLWQPPPPPVSPTRYVH